MPAAAIGRSESSSAAARQSTTSSSLSARPSRKRERDDDDDDDDVDGDAGDDGDDHVADDDVLSPSLTGKVESPSAATATTSSSSSATNAPSGGPGGASSNFRNVSACNRCRHRKNRCDQKLPRCTNCDRSNSKCVGFDPVSKREIPRSYVYFLESRVEYLESVLRANGVAFQPPEENFSISDNIKPGFNVPFPPLQEEDEPSSPSSPQPPPPSGPGAQQHRRPGHGRRQSTSSSSRHASSAVLDPALQHQDEQDKIDKLVSNIGMVSVQGASDSRYLGSTSGISFARVVFAAVKSSVGGVGGASGRSTPKPGGRFGGGNSNSNNTDTAASAAASSGGSSMRDTFFGLHTKPAIKPAPFPDKDVGRRLVELYFEHANPQIPILHRGEFMALFDRVYATDAKKRTARELYMINIVYAIGAGIINESANVEQTNSGLGEERDAYEHPPHRKRARVTAKPQPENYHSSAIVHLESFLGSSPATEGFEGGLEELQAVLLLAGLALLRPVAPGLWYIVGVAVRLSIDLGLHFEDIDPNPDSFGRKQWTRDLRRRLWWCVYTFDRLVSTCVGRPFGITDQVVTTEFPSLLDDNSITTNGFLKTAPDEHDVTYKKVSHHYFRLRLLQSEILQVLQHRQAQQARVMGANKDNAYMHTKLSSPFLEHFHTFASWRVDVDRRLWEWKESAPKPYETGVAFNPLFLELNYWQAIIMLYRQSLSAPPALASELSASTGEDVQSPGASSFETKEDEETVFLKVAQAGQTVLKIYRQLHRLKLVNYTFLATHHLFMSGISFLYAVWHSTVVRSQLTLDDVDFTILAATSVLTDLIEKCPPAEACRDAFVRMSKATISMCMSTTGFGKSSSLSAHPISQPGGGNYFANTAGVNATAVYQQGGVSSMNNSKGNRSARRQLPRFDMNLKDLFSDEEIEHRPFAASNREQFYHQQQQQQVSRLAQNDWTSPVSSIETLDGCDTSQQQQQAQQHFTHRPSSTASPSQPQLFQPPPQRHQRSYAPQPPSTYVDTLATTTAGGQQSSTSEFSFDDMGWLDTFSMDDGPSQMMPFGSAGDLDLGFATGGGPGGFDGNGNWTDNGGGVDLFDGFFFGGVGPGNGGGGGGGGGEFAA